MGRLRGIEFVFRAPALILAQWCDHGIFSIPGRHSGIFKPKGRSDYLV